jgi:hypothetical protein
MPSETRPSRRLVVVAVVAIVLIGVIAPRFMQGAIHEGEGTITHVNSEEGKVSVEVIDPANGTTREFIVLVPTDCDITINGAAAPLTALRMQDAAWMRVRVERHPRAPDGERRKSLTAERIEVTRSGGEAA